MNNHRDFFGIVLNVLIAVAILAAIIFGLNRIGLYKLPDFIENAISPSKQSDDAQSVGESKEYDSVSFDNNGETVVEKTDVTYENARKMLESVEISSNYKHEISVTRKAGEASATNKVVLQRKDGLYSAQIYSLGGVLLESIHQDGENITVKKHLSETQTKQITHPSGAFTVSELAGVVVDHENFLSGSYVLEEGDFSIIQGDFGIELEIVFDTVMDEYIQKEVYRINVDCGIVTSAKCYENDELVYDMYTLVLRDLS